MCPATIHVAATNGELGTAKRWAVGLAAVSLYTLAVHGGLEIAREQRSLPPLPLASPRIPFAVGAAAVVAVIVARRSDLRDARRDHAGRTTFIAACLGAFTFAWGAYARVPELASAGLLLSAISIASRWVDSRGVQLLLSASALLVFCVPMPGTLFNALVASLQEATAAGAERVLAAVGHAVARDGTVLALPWRATSVIETCSGLGTIHTSLAILAGYGVYSRASPRRIAVLCSGGVALAALGNVLRVAWIAAQPAAVSEAAHSAAGMATAGFVCSLAAGVERLVPRSAAPPTPRVRSGSRPPSQRSAPGSSYFRRCWPRGRCCVPELARHPGPREWRLRLPFRITTQRSRARLLSISLARIPRGELERSSDLSRVNPATWRSSPPTTTWWIGTAASSLQ